MGSALQASDILRGMPIPSIAQDQMYGWIFVSNTLQYIYIYIPSKKSTTAQIRTLAWFFPIFILCNIPFLSACCNQSATCVPKKTLTIYTMSRYVVCSFEELSTSRFSFLSKHVLFFICFLVFSYVSTHLFQVAALASGLRVR